MAMGAIGREAQRRFGVKAPGLRWGKSWEACIRTTAPRVRPRRFPDAAASRVTPRVGGKPICTDQIDSI